MKNRNRISLWVTVLFVLIILLQFVPVTRDNPPVGGDFDGQQDIKKVLKHACYNCHSNETSWPWYSNVAPFSWLIANDVNEARRHVNFSNWRSMRADDQALTKKEIWQEIERGDMPPGRYLLLHSDAKLNETEKSLIRRWASGLPSETDSAGANSHF